MRWLNQVKFLKENKYVSPSWFGLVMMLDKRFKSKKTKIMSNIKNYQTTSLFEVLNKKVSTNKIRDEIKKIFEIKFTKLYG